MREARNLVLQAGGIVLRRQACRSRVLVVRSSDERHWLFPKGRVEVLYFVLDWLGDAPADEDRETRWCTPAEGREPRTYSPTFTTNPVESGWGLMRTCRTPPIPARVGAS